MSSKSDELGATIEAAQMLKRQVTALVPQVKIVPSPAMVKTAESVKDAARKSFPIIKRTGRTAFDVLTAAGEIVFQTTSEITKCVRVPLYGPPCPKCGELTIIKRNRKTGELFAACSSWEDTGCNFVTGIVFTDEH